MKMEKTENAENDEDERKYLLPGFRFHPTEEELLGFYLQRKVERKPFKFELIKEVDLYSFDPWGLPGLARAGEREWFFFVPRDTRQQNGGRPNRITVSGYWKATGTDRRVYGQASSNFVGLKKTLVFYKGKAPKGERTDWIMNEYRLSDSNQVPTVCKRIPTNDFTLCRIYRKAATSITSFDRRPRIEPEPVCLSPSRKAALPLHGSTTSKNGSVSGLLNIGLHLHPPTAENQLRSTISKPISAEKRNPYPSVPSFSDPCVEETAIRRKASCTIPSPDEKGSKKIGLSSMEEPSMRPPKLQSSETHGFPPCLTHVNSFERWCSEIICYSPSTSDSLWDNSL